MEKARELTKRVYGVSRSGPFARDFGLRDQMCRAAVSIMSNIAGHMKGAEGGEFIQFLAIAKGSAAEVRSQLYVAADQSVLSNGDFDELSTLAADTGRMIGGLRKYPGTSGYGGTKYRTRTIRKV